MNEYINQIEMLKELLRQQNEIDRLKQLAFENEDDISELIFIVNEEIKHEIHNRLNENYSLDENIKNSEYILNLLEIRDKLMTPRK